MDEQWTVPGWAALATLVVLAVLVVVLVAALVRSRSRTTAAIDSARADAAALALQVEDIERRLAQAAPATSADDTEYVVTMLGRPGGSGDLEETGGPAPVVAAPLFADLVLREGVVQAASLAAGLRRALAPEVRHRIRFEMKREVKRARKQRRADLRQAKRDLDARQRGAEAA
jgi:hypothetical protein